MRRYFADNKLFSAPEAVERQLDGSKGPTAVSDSSALTGDCEKLGQIMSGVLNFPAGVIHRDSLLLPLIDDSLMLEVLILEIEECEGCELDRHSLHPGMTLADLANLLRATR